MESLHPSAHPITWSRLLLNCDLRYLSAPECQNELSRDGIWGGVIGRGPASGVRASGGSPASSLSMGYGHVRYMGGGGWGDRLPAL